MKTYKGFVLVHKCKLLSWLKPKARVFINTYDKTIVSFGSDNSYPSFQTVEPGSVYKIPCTRVDIHTHEWLYRVEFPENILPDAESEVPVYNVMCAKELD